MESAMIRDKDLQSIKMNCRVRLRDLNSHLMCVLCGGYYIDATTIIECLHSFCRSCIVKHLESSKYCPVCEVMVHKTKPLLNIRRDKTLQDIVYKLVPGLFSREMQDRRQFYKERPHYVKPDDVESSGQVSTERRLEIHDDSIIVSLRYHGSESTPECLRFLRCPMNVKIEHLQKLIVAKYGLHHRECYVELLLNGQPLHEDLSLLDISSLYLWKNREALKLTFIIYEKGDGKLLKKSEKEKNEDIDCKANESVIEKEVQLQITESGVMSVSEIERSINIGLQSIPLTDIVDEVGSYGIQPVVDSSPSSLFRGHSSPKPESLTGKSSVPTYTTDASKVAIIGVKTPETTLLAQPHSISNLLPTVCESMVLDTPSVNKISAVVAEEEEMDSSPKKRVSESENNPSLPKKAFVVPPSTSHERSKTIPLKLPYSDSSLSKYQNIPSNSRGSQISSVNNLLKGTSENFPRDVISPVQLPQNVGHEKNKPLPSPEKKPCKPVHKSISRATPQIWHPVITKEKLRPTLMKSSDEPRKQCKFFQSRNMPRYLGNPASGVKPMYSNGLPPLPPPPPAPPAVLRIDPKTLRSIPKEDKKSANNTLLTNPFIPRDNHFMLPDPKTQPFSPFNFPTGYHANLPPSISMLYNPQQHFRNLKTESTVVAPGKNCDNQFQESPQHATNSSSSNSSADFIKPVKSHKTNKPVGNRGNISSKSSISMPLPPSLAVTHVETKLSDSNLAQPVGPTVLNCNKNIEDGKDVKVSKDESNATNEPKTEVSSLSSKPYNNNTKESDDSNGDCIIKSNCDAIVSTLSQASLPSSTAMVTVAKAIQN